MLHIASSHGHYKYAQKLIEKIKKINKHELLSIIETKDDKEEQTALFFAIRSAPNGIPEIVDLLLKNKCQMNVLNKEGLAPLHYACELG
jgi:ankyrin repeat protein